MKFWAASTGTSRKVMDSMVGKTRNSKENVRKRRNRNRNRKRKREENWLRVSVARRAIGFSRDGCALSVACCRSLFQERVVFCVGRM